MVKPDAASGLLPDAVRREVELHLHELLTSEAFCGSRRSQEFLRYIVQESLAGRGTSIKERNIATDVFGKGSDFDTQSDSLVRVKAAEVRKRLAQAYKSGLGGRVRIELPVGRYQPVLAFPQPKLVEYASGPEPKDEVDQHYPFWKTNRWSAFLALAGAGILFAALFAFRSSRSNLDLLWGTFAKGEKPVLISLPSPNVVTWKEHIRLLSGNVPPSTPQGVSASGEGNYVGVGAAEGAAKFGEQLALRHRSFFLKFGADVSFSDLRQFPAILLGAFTSPWTMDLTRSLPFRFKDDTEVGIVDIRGPGHFWKATVGASGEPRIGYALVSRLLKADSGNAVLMAAGIDPHDTQAAVEFLTREEYFDQFAERVPDWAATNFQVVIRTSIHGHTPSAPEVVSYKTW